MGHVRKQMMSFFMTTQCNMACRYCYTSGPEVEEEDKAIDLGFAQKGIDDFFRDYPSRQIRFYGAGEPTLEIDLMKAITDYAREQAGDNLRVELQTNGFFGKKVRDWILSNVDVLWVSCDGVPEVQDYQRPAMKGKPTADIVEGNLKFFGEREEMKCGVRATVTPQTVKRQVELIEYLHRLSIRAVCAEAVVAPVDKKMDKEFKVDPIEFADDFLVAYKKAKELGMFYSCLPMANFDEEVRFACRSCVPYPHLTTDGYVSCCDIAQFGPRYSPGHLLQLIYGKYNADENRIVYDEEKIHKIRSRCTEILEKGSCKDCEIIRHCAGGCMGQVVNETGDILGTKEWSCAVTKYLAKRLPLNCGLYPVIHS